MLIHKTMRMPNSCLSCWIAPTCEVWVREKSKYKGYDDRLDGCPLEEVKHGHWEVVDGAEPIRYGCSVCKRLSWTEDNYCSYCGCKMDEVKENG